MKAAIVILLLLSIGPVIGVLFIKWCAFLAEKFNINL